MLSLTSKPYKFYLHNILWSSDKLGAAGGEGEEEEEEGDRERETRG